MAKTGLAFLEDALRARKLDRTLTTTPPFGASRPLGAPSELADLDECLGGGLPRGQLSEIAGPRSSGRTTLLVQLFAAAARRGEIAALVDPFDRLDLASLVSAGMDVGRLLWVRGQDSCRAHPGSPPHRAGLRGGDGPEALLDRTIERALKALNLVLQAGGFGMVAIDVADAPLSALNRIPFTTWLRVQRTIEGSETACVLVAPQPLARSAGGLTLSLGARPQWAGGCDRSRRLAGMNIATRVISARRRGDREITFGAQVHENRS